MSKHFLPYFSSMETVDVSKNGDTNGNETTQLRLSEVGKDNNISCKSLSGVKTHEKANQMKYLSDR